MNTERRVTRIITTTVNVPVFGFVRLVLRRVGFGAETFRHDENDHILQREDWAADSLVDNDDDDAPEGCGKWGCKVCYPDLEWYTHNLVLSEDEDYPIEFSCDQCDTFVSDGDGRYWPNEDAVNARRLCADCIPKCDECGALCEELDADKWCGSCGNCREHCANYQDCPVA